jgi:hypothetical protein
VPDRLKQLIDTLAEQVSDMQGQLAALSADPVTQTTVTSGLESVENACAPNLNSFAELDFSPSDPPITADLIEIQNFLNGMVVALQR